MSMIILDSVENINLDTNNMPIANLQSILHAKVGLHTLAVTIRKEEIDVKNGGYGPAPVMMTMGFPKNTGLINSCFNWYSITLMSYLRLIKLIYLMYENTWSTADLQVEANKKIIKKECVKYVKSIAPEIYMWRNKVAAHFAATDPSNADNLGTLEQSLMGNIDYHKPYFTAASFLWTSNNEKSQLKSWALTKNFEDLSQRFWPEHKISKI
ncbi:MAG: hypothetical protein A2Y40_03780 [Candidatus Margulisbacteria bacterium GWF2_35_9]|nr:MAG: hypothetical protein A2Y40_03780 [Candidatus Margulisbacteria bacterium GWF2_35_9]